MQQLHNTQISAAMQRAEVLVEALPWIHEVNGKTIVVKYGGAAMESPELCKQVIADIELLKLVGVRVVLVHGGGKAINHLLERLGLDVSFHNGLRITDDAVMEAVQMSLLGQVNQSLVQNLNEYGNKAVGLSGLDGRILRCEQLDKKLGRVGKVVEVQCELIETVLDNGYIPVIASVGYGADGLYNVNADIAAGKIAQALEADTLMFLTNEDGLYAEYGNNDSLISLLTRTETHELLQGNSLQEGMIPKISAIAEALDAGVGDVRIINGTFPHSLLIEIFTDAGLGTMFIQDEKE